MHMKNYDRVHNLHFYGDRDCIIWYSISNINLIGIKLCYQHPGKKIDMEGLPKPNEVLNIEVTYNLLDFHPVSIFENNQKPRLIPEAEYLCQIIQKSLPPRSAAKTKPVAQ